MKKILSFIVLLFLTGCALENESSQDEVPNFTLQELGVIPLEDEENPTLYRVAEGEVTIFRNDVMDVAVIGQSEETYELEDVVITEDEIIVTYEGEEDRFKWLSSSVVENENKIQYQYFGPEVEE